MSRETPFHKDHSVEVAGLMKIEGGDDRFFNNIFIGPNGLAPYDKATRPMQMAGNVFLKGAQPSTHEQNPLVQAQSDPRISLTEEEDRVTLRIVMDKAWAQGRSRPLVTTELLGKAKLPDLPYEQADGSAYRLDSDYFGKKRDAANPYPGPFEVPAGGEQALTVWPVAASK